MPKNSRKKDEINNGVELPGWPGYRTRANRSGLDPLDTRSEAAHMEGTFLRNIFTLQARTKNPFYLVLMFVFGVVPFVITLVLLIGSIPGYDGSALRSILYLVLTIFVTGAITINFLLSIFEVLRIIPPQKRTGSPNTREKKKRLPKRRKDYR